MTVALYTLAQECALGNSASMHLSVRVHESGLAGSPYVVRADVTIRDRKNEIRDYKATSQFMSFGEKDNPPAVLRTAEQARACMAETFRRLTAGRKEVAA